MLNDKRIKSCSSRFDIGAYSRLQFLRAVRHSVGAHTESLQPVHDNSSSSEDEDEDRQSPCLQRQLQRRRNRQRQPRQQPRTTVAKCASWRNVLAPHWCRADISGSVKRVLCVCQLWMGDIDHSIYYYFIVRPNVDQRAGQPSLPHEGITKRERNRTKKT